MRAIVYQALISNPASLARIKAAEQQVAAKRGRIWFGPTTKTGLVTVFLELPEPWSPSQILPEVPFYPV